MPSTASLPAGKQAELDAPQISPGGAASARDRLDGLSDHVGADLFAMMEVFHKLSQLVRETSRLNRSGALNDQVKTQLAAAEKIRDAAQARFTGALCSSIGQGLGGAVQMGGGFMSARKLSGENAYQAAELSRTISDRAAGLNSLSVTGGQIGHSVTEKKAAEHDAIKSELEATTAVHNQARDDASEFMNQMQDVIRDIREKLYTIEQSVQASRRGIAQNIGSR